MPGRRRAECPRVAPHALATHESDRERRLALPRPTGEKEDSAMNANLRGVLSDDERRTWEAASRLGHADAARVARETDAEPRAVEEALDSLCRRRLMMCVDGRYAVVGSTYE